MLLIASYFFYGWWDVRFLFLIVLSTYIDYCTSLMIGNGKLTGRQNLKATLFLVGSSFLFVTCRWSQFDWTFDSLSTVVPGGIQDWWPTFFATGFILFLNGIIRTSDIVKLRRPDKFLLFWSIFVNLLILGVFKYFNFFADSFVQLWQWLFKSVPGEFTIQIILPVGISFFTFQTMSHTIDVFRRKMPATDSLLELGTYVAFFPQLVAGPIERGAHLLPQFQRPRTITFEDIRSGMWLIFWGLYKKIVVADNVAAIVNQVFRPYDSGRVTELPSDGLLCLVALYAFAVQIYCDFSGYTDMARGTAKLLGFDIMLNFNLPYISRNPSEFWRRWHISLSSWLRDYLYIPLGGNRGSTLSTYRNLLITMILGGLWHGAAWTFVLWGAFHGGILIVYRLIGDVQDGGDKLSLKSLVRGVVMFHLVCFGWLLFRAQNLETVGAFLTAMITRLQGMPETLELLSRLFFYSWFLILFQGIQAWTHDLDPMRNWHWFVRLNVWIFVIVSLFRLAPMGSQQFIYFAF